MSQQTVEDTPAYRSMMETNARTIRVERTMKELLRPMFVWRMAKAQVHEKGPRGRSAQTRYFNATREIDDILKEYDAASEDIGGE